MDWSRSERSERWVFFAWIRADALQHHLAVGAEGVADAVALAQAKSPPHGLRHGGLIEISERRFHLPLGGACRNAVGIRNERRKQTYGNADALPWRAARVESSSRQALDASRSPKPEPSATASTPASSHGSTSPGLRPPAAMQ